MPDPVSELEWHLPESLSIWSPIKNNRDINWWASGSASASDPGVTSDAKKYRSTIKNNVWDIVPRPKDKSVVSSKWIYKIKHAADGSVEKCKAIFVTRGFTQKEGIDYNETFSLVARYISIWVIIALASVLGWKLHQMDVKTTFLNGKIE